MGGGAPGVILFHSPTTIAIVSATRQSTRIPAHSNQTSEKVWKPKTGK